MPWSYGKVVDWDEEILYAKSLTSAAVFVGTYDSRMHYNYGDICVKDGCLYMFNGKNDWTEIGSYSEPTYEALRSYRKFITNCPNCGAPMQNHKCMYCGTEDYGN